MVTVIINKEILCNLMFEQKEAKVIIEQLENEKLKELLTDTEIFVDRTLTEKELEYIKTAVEGKITYPITVTSETLKGLKTLMNLTIIAIVIRETVAVENRVTFFEPRYYLVTISLA